tara:strand:+ start:387 stop:2150 length:1764 start_codon:yes stop_codon:yes gene_type:complete
LSLENLKHIFEEHGTETNTNSKAFFGSPIGGPVPQPYSGNPPNSNLLNFNSNNDNFVSPFQTSPNPLFVFNEANSNEGVFTINGIEKTKFTAPAFPENYTAQNSIINNEFKNNDILGKHGWPDLYNSDHTSKDINNPSPKSQNPFQPRSGNLNIRSKADTFLGIPARVDLIGFGEGEPYIVSKIPNDDEFLNGRVINFGNRNLPLVRATTDAVRIGKYLTSPQGLLNIALKNADLVIPQTVVRSDGEEGGDGKDRLIRVPQRFNTGYNPLATLLAISPLSRLIGHGPGLLTKSGMTGVYVGSGADNPTPGFSVNSLNDLIIQGQTPEYHINSTFTKATDDGETDGLFSLKNLSSFLTRGGTVKKTSSGDKVTLAKMIEGNYLTSTTNGTKGLNADNQLNFDVEKKEEGMPFYFKDLRDSKYIFFRAYLDGITESITPEWSPTNYIGRSEPVWVYGRAEREISFNLKLFAHTEKELGAIYAKMNKLTSLCYPQYAQDERLNDKTRMKPPLMKLRMGDLFGKVKEGNKDGGLLGFLASLSYTIPEESTWETENGMKVPKHIQASITYKVIHGKVPDMDTQFYGYKGGGV